MRWLTGLVLAAFVLWGGYWFVGSGAMRRTAEDWFATAPERGLVAEKTSLVVRGFPNRFDLTVEGVRIGDPARGLFWQAPFAQVFMLSYKPWHMIAALPNEQTLSTEAGSFDIRSSRMMGSLVVVPGAALSLDRLRAEAKELRVTGPGGGTVETPEAYLALDREAAREAAYRLGGSVRDLLLPSGVAAQTGLPAMISALRLDATLQLTAPLDRNVVETQPRLAGLSLSSLSLVWGPVTLSASGDLVADVRGFASGALDIKVQNWREALIAARGAGLIESDTEQSLERALTVMAAAGGGDPAALDIPLRFENGQIRLGLIPLGPAPVLGGQRQ